ncbi:MAG TPA: CotH kinase family protein [Verrucomicrobiales bacterium]|nr:CotH kinase family protein [Verrucomicrobiales bacterium]
MISRHLHPPPRVLSLALAFSLSLALAKALGDVRFNEILAVNLTTLADSDGDFSDWIEFSNPGAAPASLAGHTLEHDSGTSSQWSFPANASIPAGGYLVIYASGKDRSNIFSPSHTSFRLNRGGGYMALRDAGGAIVAEIEYPRQYNDVSFDGAGFMVEPTPGGPNSATWDGPESEVVFSVSSGLFTGSLTVELSAPGAEPSSKIHFATGKSVARPSLFNVYTQPLVLSASAHVTAIVVEPGRIPSEPRAEAFLRVSPEVLDFTSNLPIVLLDNQGGNAPSERDLSFATWMLFEPDPETGRTSLRDEPALVTRSGLRRRGSSTIGNPKYSLAVEAWRDDADADVDIAPLGLPPDSDWVLSARYTFDRALIRNPFTYELSRRMGNYAPRTRFVEVFINSDGDELGDGAYLTSSSGDYFGVYTLMEKIKRSPDRVDIEKAVAGHTSGLGLTGGYMLRVDRVSKADPEIPFNAGGQGDLVWNDPKQEHVTTQQDNYIKTYLNGMAAAMRSDDAENPETGYRAYIDTRSWIVEHMIRMFTKDPDGLRLSTYLYKPRGGKLHYGPVWDFDRTLGCDSDARAQSPLDWNPSSGVDFLTYTWFNNLIGSAVRTGGQARRPDFWQEWIDYWQTFRRGPLSEESLHALIDSLAGEIAEAQARNFTRWPAVAPNGGNGNGAFDYDDGIPGWAGEIQHLKGWVRERVRWIDNQFVAPPIIDSPGGIVPTGTVVRVRAPDASLFNPVSVEYTVDGPDPRASGGDRHTEAVVSPADLTINATGSYFFRCRDDAEWSGPVRVHFAVDAVPAGPGALLVSELMYHPAPPSANELDRGYRDGGSFEFVELFNPGPEPVYLGDLAFTQGIRFQFSEGNRAALSPGERVLLVRDPEAFAFRYGPGLPVLGAFEGSLDNGGETLTLTVDPEGEAAPVFTFRYDDEQPWPSGADGFGHSLSLTEPVSGVDLGNPANWSAETTPGGTPGLPPVSLVLSVFIHEVIPASQPGGASVLELHNPHQQDIDLEGWRLSHDPDDPTLWSLPSGHVLPAAGFLVLRPESLFGSSFRLDPAGGTLMLMSPSLEGSSGFYRHLIEYDAIPAGHSAGRYLNSAGEERFILLQEPTPGEANALPLIGPIVFSELLYHPADNGPAAGIEFLELTNIGSMNVPLHHPNDPGLAWRISGIDYTLPGDLSLAPGEVLVVARADPEEFRALLSMPSSLQIAGPFAGKLDNAGETIRLRQPVNTTGENAEISYATVDAISYDDEAPWPAEADGLGPSLERVHFTVYGDDVSAWRASVPGGTPGTVPSLPPDESWMEWAMLHFSEEELSEPALSGPDADPDGDGSPNLAEFAFGAHPRMGGDAPSLVPHRDGENETVGLILPIAPPDSLIVELQWSPDLRVWRLVEGAELSPAGGNHQLLSAAAPEESAAGYLRLRIMLRP